MSAPGPVPGGERIVRLDVVRGVAVGGILLVNMLWFAGVYVPVAFHRPEVTTTLDLVALRAVQILAEGKFLALFSLLFGVGVSMQAAKFGDDRRGFRSFHRRRMAVLLAIGVLHALLLSPGDILVSYALIALLWRPMLYRAERTVLLLAIGLLCAPGVLGWLTGPPPPEVASFGPSAQAIASVYGAGSLGEIFALRAFQTVGYLFYTLFEGGWLASGMFLLGVWLHRTGRAAAGAPGPDVLRRVVVGGAALGLPLALFWTVQRHSNATAFGTGPLGTLAFAFAAAILSLTYAAALAWWADVARGYAARAAAAMGRLALTNYLLQSVLATTLFLSYGAGWYGRVGPAACVALTLLVVAAQAAWSVWYLRRHGSGPVERLWRRWSYGRARRGAAAPASVLLIAAFVVTGTAAPLSAQAPRGFADTAPVSAQGPRGFADALVSAPPADPDDRARLEGFGRLVGSWDVEVTYRPVDGPAETVPGEWHFSWVLEGRAVQDVWRVPAAGEEGVGELRGYGTTVRLFDAELGAWRSVWFSARSGSVTAFVGREVGGELHLEPERPDPEERYRWVFFAVTPTTFRWRAESSTDGGVSWRTEQEMSARRRTTAGG